MAWDCRRWRALPEAGGMRDQPVVLMARMAVAEDVFDALYAFNRLVPGTGADWVTRNPRAWEIVQRANGWI